MSKFLAVDCSSGYLLAAAYNDGKRAVEYIPDCASCHSVELMGAIERAMEKAGLTCGGCDFFAAVTGPGSFTGIRIGISTVKGLATGAGKPMLGITSFDLAAYNVNSDNFCAVIDAAHSHYYVCGYGANAFPPAYMSRGELLGLGCPIYGTEELDLPGYTRVDAAENIIDAVLAKEGFASGTIGATYVRKSQAEEGRK